MRKPRLNSAVATVAVETDLNLLRVVSLSFVMRPYPGCRSFRRDAKHRASDAQLRIGESLPGLVLRTIPERRGLINRRLVDRRAERRFEKVKVAALIGLPD